MEIDLLLGPLTIDLQLGLLTIGLFTSRLSHHNFSARDPILRQRQSMPSNSHWQDDVSTRKPLWGLILRILTEVRIQGAEQAQPWYPILLMLIGMPLLLPLHQVTVIQVRDCPLPLKGETLQSKGLFCKGFQTSGCILERKIKFILQLTLFYKWERWCYCRERNPFSGPIANIVNSLAELFADGSQYGLLNSY